MTRDWVSVLARLARGKSIAERVVLVTAHPDDETIGMGGALGLFARLTIIELTDGAIDDPDAWTKAGVESRTAYAARRRTERNAALDALGATGTLTACAVMDQQTTQHLPALIASVTSELVGAAAVFTHPYEGGHPDHDSAALVVQEACDVLAREGCQVPDRFEFASYHWDGQRRVVGRFWPPQEVVTSVRLTGDRLLRKQRALSAYVSQQSVIRWFDPSIERYRIAPRYDFTQPPPPPSCLYDRKAWKTTSAQWRSAAAAAMAGQAVPA